ncbi:MAG: hypothetical protein QW650_09210 [Thermofilum sp.]
MERLASGESRKGLRARLGEWVEKRGAELQELFGEYGLGVDARRLLRSAVRDAVFFSLPRSLLEWYGSLILEVREGLEGAGGEVWDELTFHGSTAIVVRGVTAWVKVGYPPSRLFTARFRRSVSAEEAVVALAARRLIPPGGGEGHQGGRGLNLPGGQPPRRDNQAGTGGGSTPLKT